MDSDTPQYESLFAYIDFFAQRPKIEWSQATSGTVDDGSPCFTIPYPMYPEEVDAFIAAFYSNGISVNYQEILTRRFGMWCVGDFPELLATADLETLRAMLTACIRGERFVEGCLAQAIESGLIADILLRMRDEEGVRACKVCGRRVL